MHLGCCHIDYLALVGLGRVYEVPAVGGPRAPLRGATPGFSQCSLPNKLFGLVSVQTLYQLIFGIIQWIYAI